MVEVIITTAVITTFLIIMAQFAYCDAKRRIKARRRKLRRAVHKRVGTQSHRVFHRVA